jgi:hypothetical protein
MIGAGGGSHPMGPAVPGQFFFENCFAESYRCSQHTCAMNPGEALGKVCAMRKEPSAMITTKA